MNSEPKIIAVIVTFQPDTTTLAALLGRLLTQTSAVVIADNGPAGAVARLVGEHRHAHLHHLDLGGNIGLAAALNRGVAHALSLGATHLLLSDQDSQPAPDMVERLLAACRQKEAEGIRVAAVGPRFIDRRSNNPPPFLRVVGHSLRRQCCNGEQAMPEVDYLITSGSLIPVSAWQAVGGMREELFIDCVDTEWGLRAQSLGWRSFGVCAAQMEHALGEQPRTLFGKAFPTHSPLRHYYMARNAVWLYRQPGLPGRWKVAHGKRLLLQLGFYSLLTPPRFSHCRAMLLGIWHGWHGRLGPR